MRKHFRPLFAVFVAISLVFPTTARAANDTSDFQAIWDLQQGDWLLINIEENSLQLVRDDSSEISEKIGIGSGKILPEGKKMHYLGLAYDPRTPEKVWEIRSKHQQNWYNVFGSKESKEQLFLRLYEVKGEKRIWSHYGIHTTPEIDNFLSIDNGFTSWGCVLVRYSLLKMLEELYELNGKTVRVVTTHQEAEEIIALIKAF